MDPSGTIACERCGKTLFVGCEPRFDCPYCGAEIIVAKYENETAEDRCRRLEREVERAKLREQIASQAAADWFWQNPMMLFSWFSRYCARNALDQGDLEAAQKCLAEGERRQRFGCLLMVIVAIVVVVLACTVK